MVSRNCVSLLIIPILIGRFYRRFETVGSFETSGTSNPTVPHNYPEDWAALEYVTLCFANFEELASVKYHKGVRILELMIVGEAKLSVKIRGWTQLISGLFVDFFGPRHIGETFPRCHVTPLAGQQTFPRCLVTPHAGQQTFPRCLVTPHAGQQTFPRCLATPYAG